MWKAWQTITKAFVDPVASATVKSVDAVTSATVQLTGKAVEKSVEVIKPSIQSVTASTPFKTEKAPTENDGVAFNDPLDIFAGVDAVLQVDKSLKQVHDTQGNLIRKAMEVDSQIPGAVALVFTQYETINQFSKQLNDIPTLMGDVAIIKESVDSLFTTIEQLEKLLTDIQLSHITDDTSRWRESKLSDLKKYQEQKERELRMMDEEMRIDAIRVERQLIAEKEKERKDRDSAMRKEREDREKEARKIKEQFDKGLLKSASAAGEAAQLEEVNLKTASADQKSLDSFLGGGDSHVDLVSPSALRYQEQPASSPSPIKKEEKKIEILTGAEDPTGSNLSVIKN